MDNILDYSLNTVLLTISIVLLWKGAVWLVDSASKVGRRLGLSDLTVGLTIVAFGTSAPEFAVTIGAALQGHSDISVGNIVGSNIFNLGFILGGCAAFRSLTANTLIVRRDGLILLGSSLALLYFFSDLELSRLESGAMVAGLLGYLLLILVWKPETVIPTSKGVASWKDVLLIVVGIAAVILGGQILVRSASSLAALWGVSEWIIAITIVAGGTSAPEFVTSLVAAAKGHKGISLGNLIGSNLFNTLGVLGIAGAIRPMSIDGGSVVSLYFLIGISMLGVVFLWTGNRITRMEGGILAGTGLVLWGLSLLG